MVNIELLTHIVAFLLLLARLGDVGSTYLATPTLKLEANPIVRRFKWPFAILTIFAAAIPYYSLPIGIIFLVVSLLVCSSNFTKLWLMRAMGEYEYHKLVVRLASQARLPSTMLFILAPAICMGILGLLLLCFYPDPAKDWGYYFSYGFFCYAFAIGLWWPLAFLRFRKEGNRHNNLRSSRDCLLSNRQTIASCIGRHTGLPLWLARVDGCKKECW